MTPTGSLFLLVLTVLVSSLQTIHAFSFQLPKFPNPFGGNSNIAKPGPSTTTTLNPGSTILVIGGTGGVGQLVTKKLRSRNYSVRVASRDVGRAIETLDDPEVQVVPLNLVGTSERSDDVELKQAFQDVNAVVISIGTTAFPTKKWAGGNTPQAIDQEAVVRLARAAASTESIQKLVLLTSVGVERTKEMPFLILNLFGVLDAKRAGEQAVIRNSSNGNYDYAIVRPGRLVGGPYTNLDLAKLMQIDGGAENGVEVQVGDALLGDCKRDACAEAAVQCLENAECQNVDFSIISTEEAALTAEEWSAAFARMQQEQKQQQEATAVVSS